MVPSVPWVPQRAQGVSQDETWTGRMATLSGKGRGRSLACFDEPEELPGPWSPPYRAPSSSSFSSAPLSGAPRECPMGNGFFVRRDAVSCAAAPFFTFANMEPLLLLKPKPMASIAKRCVLSSRCWLATSRPAGEQAMLLEISMARFFVLAIVEPTPMISPAFRAPYALTVASVRYRDTAFAMPTSSTRFPDSHIKGEAPRLRLPKAMEEFATATRCVVFVEIATPPPTAEPWIAVIPGMACSRKRTFQILVMNGLIWNGVPPTGLTG
mmetsp:Transcript_30061/g.75969  ORF Transcript_30061/g.75969 Transcript_30061/m.75969 type:complete len:268 (-) Transcript_30061:154-957(-)